MPVAKAVARVACANGIGRSILDLAAQIFDARAQTLHSEEDCGFGRCLGLDAIVCIMVVKVTESAYSLMPGVACFICQRYDVWRAISSGQCSVGVCETNHIEGECV